MGRPSRLEVRPRSRSTSAPWILGLAALTLAGAAYGATAPEIRIEPTTLYFGAAAPAAATAAVGGEKSAQESVPALRPEAVQALREKASRQRTVRVLVRLAAPFVPEGGLGHHQDVLDQRQAIDRVQDATLGKLEKTRAKLHARFEYIPFLALEVDAAALDLLARLPEVTGIEEDTLDRPSLASSTAVIGAGVAWASGWTGDGQVIAILDTGVDKTHPFFSSGAPNKVVSEACYSASLNGTTSVCPGGVEESTAPGSGVSCSVSGCEHGTHVAGIAAGNDGAGPNFGVARGADLIAIQVFTRADSYCGVPCVGSWISDQIKGLERVYALAGDFDIAAVNMSLGGGLYSSRASCDADNAARKAAIDNLRSIDIATVVSAGNEGYAGYLSAPACISSAVSVGATDDGDNVAYFSNIASFLDLLAPGVAVTSSVPGGGTASFDGTSMAAPHVAGAWAVLKQANPSATVGELVTLLRDTGVPLSEYGINNMRRINLGRAVTGGPLVPQSFIIHNDGTAVLSVLSLQLETHVPWIRWSPEAPFDIPPGGAKPVSVSVDFSGAPDGESMHRLVVTSSDADESPYPGAVFLVVHKEPCHLLTRTRTGSGSNPAPSPASSPGCPAGRFHAGEVIQLAAQAGTGSSLASWSGTANDASTATTNSLTMPAGPHTVSVTYVAACYALTLSHTGSGTDPVASPASSPSCPAGQYSYAEDIQLTASPARGWRVLSWTNTGHDGSRGVTNSLRMPASAVTVTVNYQEGLPGVLVVDASFGSTSILPYTAAVGASGRIYDVWNVATDGNPDASSLAAYPRVVWFPGTYDGLNPSQEAVLGTYLNGGGSLFLSASEYIFYWGFTPFIQTYLGVGSYAQDVSYNRVTGQGSSFSGFGPYDLSFSAFSDQLSPAPGVEAAFSWEGFGSFGNAGVSKAGPGYRTIFLGFPFNALPTAEARRDVMEASLDYLGTVFADVPRGHWAKKWVEALYRNGVTQGCGLSPRVYCPETDVTRNQMAFFLLRAKEGTSYTPPPCTTPPFNDVPVDSPYCPWVQELALRGITSGCGNGSFCPVSPVTRQQTAFFLLTAIEGTSYTPPPCTESPFIDVPVESSYCPWIKELAVRGLTLGCGGGNYCPTAPVTRAQMAKFLITSFGLPLF